MAIATLERCYNNESVFEGVVKIRRGETVRLMQQATNIENVKSIFVHFIKKVGTTPSLFTLSRRYRDAIFVHFINKV